MQRDFSPGGYGDGMADVYDEWYAHHDPGPAVDRLSRMAGTGRVLELGVGTGRLAVPLAATGAEVHGVDASPAMLERLRARPGSGAVHAVLGDMADEQPTGPFDLVFVAANTFFCLDTEDAQRRCLIHAARRLAPQGVFVLEAFVPDDRIEQGGSVEVRRVEATRVVLFVNMFDPASQRATGQHVDISEQGVRLRPSRIRYATPGQLDAMAADAGLRLRERWADWSATPFTRESTAHVSVYGLAGAPTPHPDGGGGTAGSAS